MAVHDLARIEEKIDRAAAGSTEVAMHIGGVQFKSMVEVLEFSKLMAVSGAAVPQHLRGNPGACLAICTRALRFGFDPFTLAEHSYLVNNKGQELIAYDSFVVHAVIEAHAPIVGRLRFEIIGEGDERRCRVTATPTGEDRPLEFLSETLGKLREARGRNEYGKIKGSPLWEQKPEQQLIYSSRRDFCRIYFPETLMGVYDRDEFDGHVGPDNAKDVSEKPDVASRLKGSKGRGFSAQHVERETSRGVIDESANIQSSAPADAGAGQVERTASLNSPEAPSAPQPPQASPASGQEAEEAATPDAGASQSPGVQIPAGEERQATESGASALHGSGGLPDGLRADWKSAYAAALGRAQKIGSLNKVAKDFWGPLGGYEKIKSTPHFADAEAIYALFRDYFGDAHREKREAMLHEMGVEA